MLVNLPALPNHSGALRNVINCAFIHECSVCRTAGSSCGGGQQMIIHGWGRNAPALTLPEGEFIYLFLPMIINE